MLSHPEPPAPGWPIFYLHLLSRPTLPHSTSSLTESGKQHSCSRSCQMHLVIMLPRKGKQTFPSCKPQTTLTVITEKNQSNLKRVINAEAQWWFGFQVLHNLMLPHLFFSFQFFFKLKTGFWHILLFLIDLYIAPYRIRLLKYLLWCRLCFSSVQHTSSFFICDDLFFICLFAIFPCWYPCCWELTSNV